MTKAQQVYEKVEALIASGVSRSDAFRQVAEEFGQPFNSMRGAYYQYSRQLKGGPSRTRRRETTPDDAVASAVSVLRRAIDAVDAEIIAAEARVTEAKAEFDALKASAKQRKAEIEAKIAALDT